MRKVIVSMNVTLDGYLSGPEGELDWHFDAWSADMAGALCTELNGADTILLGRESYLAMSAYWSSCGSDLYFPREDLAFADMMNNHKKIVFSKTLEYASWKNSTLWRGTVRAAISDLRKQPGKNIIVYGSGKLVDALVAEQLVDIYRLWLHPVALGRGRALFKKLRSRLNLKPESIERFSSGVIALSYDAF
ncbi:dihydrofolate reductase [Pedobacter yulinensis]|uniref:Dihydrofolate reductase n=1 Tax=Pedobacter yulinensis TaxID=2126353 RepID=A0A2T3HLG4_9SPHI|nr:dihydrofolate reductase family protein [Pedobacter yulinensis]PST83231.1 dihydrofolate reductase [Pedobacter yulinensis]